MLFNIMTNKIAWQVHVTTILQLTLNINKKIFIKKWWIKTLYIIKIELGVGYWLP